MATATPDELIAQEDSPLTVIGRVLDERTDEPVPDLSVALSCGTVLEEVVTKEDGSFGSRKNFPRGTLDASVRDLDVEIAQRELEFDPAAPSGEWTIRVRIGPTCSVEFEGDSPLASGSGVARLVESARPSGIAGVILVRADDLREKPALESIGDRQWPWTKLRPGRLPWIRYPTVLWIPDEKLPPHLEVELASSGIAGTGAVRSTIGVQPPTKVQTTEPFSKLSGEIVLSSEPPVSHWGKSGACVLLIPPEGTARDPARTPMWHEAWPTASGSFSFRHVKPGSWKLLAYASDHQVVERKMELPTGSTRLDPIRLSRSTEDGVIELGSAEPASEPTSGRTLVRLRLSAAAGLGRAWLDHWSDGPSGRVEFFNLPTAEFDLSEIAVGGSALFRPFATKVSTPSQLLDLKPVQIAEESVVEFDIRRADTLTLLEPCDVWFGPRGSIYGVPHSGTEQQWRVPKDAPIQWSVWSPGYAPVFGDDSSLVGSPDGRVARVMMKSGWGASLLFRAASPDTLSSQDWTWHRFSHPGADLLIGALACPPLTGVRVQIDSETIAVSDIEGEAHIVARERPTQLVLLSDGWKLLGVEPAPTPQSRIPQQYIVWMDRE